MHRPSTMIQRLVLAVGSAAICAVILGAGLSTAVAQEETNADDDLTIEQRFIQGIMSGLGAETARNRGINYRERSPLVIPPNLNLPTPENAAKVEQNPAWPKDPDVQRRKKAAKAAITQPRNYDLEGYPLTPAELNKRSKTAPKPRTDVPPSASNDYEMYRVLKPNELGYKGGIFNFFGKKEEERATFVEEPPRTDLTMPPVGYQTPAPSAPYGINTVDRSQLPKAVKPEDIGIAGRESQ